MVLFLQAVGLGRILVEQNPACGIRALVTDWLQKRAGVMLYLSNEEGQALPEYSLILVSVFIVVLALFVLLGDEVIKMFTLIADEVTKAVSG